MSDTGPSPHSTTPRTVLISGASIAGPALAYWLHRYGFAVTVVERAPAPRTGGYKVDIRGAAIEVAERMGILEDIQRASTDMRTGAYVNDDGKRIATLPADIFGARVGRDDEIMRGDLARILHERTRADVEYFFGDSITSITPVTDGAAGVDVTFEHAAPRHFDLVVGADGLHSTVRRLAFGPEEQFVRHLGAYISAFSMPNELGLDREELYHALPGRLICAYSSAGDPAAKGLLVFRSPRLRYDHRDPRQQLALLDAAFEGVGVEAAPARGWGQVPRMLEAAREAGDLYFDGMQLIEMDRWSHGRVVLLGDAAHCPSPASGQGTGMALVGAYVLAGELAAALPRPGGGLRALRDGDARLCRGQSRAGEEVRPGDDGGHPATDPVPASDDADPALHAVEEPDREEDRGGRPASCPGDHAQGLSGAGGAGGAGGAEPGGRSRAGRRTPHVRCLT